MMEGSADAGEPSVPVPVKMEELTAENVKMEEGVGNGSNEENGGILVDIPTVVVKEEVMSDSKVGTEEDMEENEPNDKEVMEENEREIDEETIEKVNN